MADDVEPSFLPSPRAWPWAVAVLVLVIGAARLKVAEDHAATRSQFVAVLLDDWRDGRLTAAVAATAECAEQPTCDPKAVQPLQATDEDIFWWSDAAPELVPYLELCRAWNDAVLAALDPDGHVTDPAALASLAAGPKPAELRAELTRFNTTIADEYDHERLMARITGWGWKLALAASALCVVFGVRRRVGYSRRAPYSSGAVV